MALPTFQDQDIERGPDGGSKSPIISITRPASILTTQKEPCSDDSFTSDGDSITPHYLHQDINLPKKRYGRAYRNLRHTIFLVYHRLNAFFILLNVTLLIGLAMSQKFRGLIFDITCAASAANFALAVLIRQELVINMLYTAIDMVPQSMPLKVRRILAKIYHLGGIHSGASIAATIWFGYLNGLIMRDWRTDDFSIAIVALTIALDVILVLIIAMSHPILRAKFHDSWELTHRYGGYLAVILFWVHTVLVTVSQDSSTQRSMAIKLALNPVPWCLLVITLSLFLPWCRLRKVPVRTEPLSRRAIRLHFDFGRPSYCAALRVATNPWKDWHAFAVIPRESGDDDDAGFSMLVANAGDFTSRIISSEPTTLWVKGVPTFGVLHVATLFRRTVLVATGSGIGPILSLLSARVDARVLWSAPNPRSTFGRAIVDQVRATDRAAVVIDTAKTGRPDLATEAYRLYRASGAEAVFVISNPAVTRKVVYALESRGVPVFAPIFDS